MRSIAPIAASAMLLAACCRVMLAADPAPGQPKGPEPALEVVQTAVGARLVRIPAGSFAMGQHDSQNLDEKPRHTVQITKAFYLGMHEVTNAQWKKVMGSVPSKWKDDDRPVEQVSWEDAQAFCRKLSALPEEQKAGRVYRLPTEAEWEYACRAMSKPAAGTAPAYSFGADATKLGDYAWFEANSDSQTHPVGQKQPNAWGLFDMHGNVWEWCSDWFGVYGPPVNDVAGTWVDPQGPTGGSDRVRRSGSWLDPAAGCRAAVRNGRDPTFRNGTLGLRLAADTPPDRFASFVPTSFTSAAKADGAIAADGTVMVTGSHAKDTYTLKGLAAPAGKIRGFRLETLPDPSLPKQGPGRAAAGNFVLSHVAVSFVPAGAAATTAPTPVAIVAAKADVTPSGYPVAAAFDGNPATGWGIAAGSGKPHVATFFIPGDVVIPENAQLSILLDQQHVDAAGPATIGKFRISLIQEAAK